MRAVSADVAQLARAGVSYAPGPGFDSLRRHHANAPGGAAAVTAEERVSARYFEMSTTEPNGLDFPAWLRRVRRAVDQRLAVLWDQEIASLRAHGDDVVAMASAARDLTMRGGKRYRPALLAAAYAGVAPDAPLEPAYQAGLALELLQSYLLIQDDWVDGDVVRRGGPAVHAALEARLESAHLGASTAVLASDRTWGLALRVLADIELPPARVVAAMQVFARTHLEVVLGQSLDVLGGARDVEVVHDLKTGSYTSRGPLLLGATLAGAPPEVLDALRRFAGPVGLAFQLRDDLLGTFGATADTGKPVGNDVRTGKRTAIVAEAEPRLSPSQRADLERAFGRAQATEQDVAAATAALDACGARAAVQERLRRLCTEAEALADALPWSREARVLLAGAATVLSTGAVNAALLEPGSAKARQAGP